MYQGDGCRERAAKCGVAPAVVPHSLPPNHLSLNPPTAPHLLPCRLIDSEVLPVLKQSSLAGAAEYRTQCPLLRNQPHAVDVLIDVLSDRGFRCALLGVG